jgi:OmcA/MtrC family decaheme c-type cytochrome
MSLVSRTALTFLAGLVAVPMTPVTHTSPSTGPAVREAAPVAYSATEKEFFLAPDQLTYIRPGLNMRIASVTNVAAGQKPVVEFYLTDDLTGPLDRYGILTPGVVTPRFIIGMWNPSTRRYINVVGTSGTGSDRTGTFQDFEVGHYKYTFFNALATTYDPTQATTLVVFGSRDTTAIVGKNYYATPQYKDWVPSTNAAATTFNAMTVARCNQCHDPIAPHGGNYRDIRQCVLCHNPNGMKGTAAPFDGQVFFHQLHQGKNATVGAITYPQDIRFCTTCHDPAAAGGANWYTYPSVAACGSCHDNVNFTTGANHAAGPAADGTCASCHQPQGNKEWDAGIKNAHIVPLLSSQLKGYTASIVSVTNVGPGKKITVTFKLQNGDGSFVDPGYFKVTANGSLNILLGGNTADYTNPGASADAQPFREAAQTATYNSADGTAVYTFTNAIPATATGTWTASIETRRAYTLNPAPNLGPATVNEGAPNVPLSFAVTGKLTPRRTLVTLAKCNVCHARLDILFSHGNQRIAIEHCVICHNPNADDSPTRNAVPTAPQPPESISFARMIHRIHSGDTLEQDYTIYGFGGAVSTFNDVTYPGDRRNCVACHSSATVVELPLPITNVPVITNRDFFSPRGSATSACTGCHDSRDVAAHAFINTAFFPNNPTVPAEACGTCHGTGADLDVAKVHAR